MQVSIKLEELLVMTIDHGFWLVNYGVDVINFNVKDD